jgi:isoleucyl-tRNA synthetase
MKSVNEAVINMSQEQIAELERNGNITLQVEGVDAPIELADVEIFSEDVPGWTVANEGALTVALDVEVTDDLRREGVAREIVKKIQAMRKESGFDIVDRIAVEIASSEATNSAVEQFNAYICNQVLADELKVCDNVEGDNVVELDDVAVKLSVRKL